MCRIWWKIYDSWFDSRSRCTIPKSCIWYYCISKILLKREHIIRWICHFASTDMAKERERKRKYEHIDGEWVLEKRSRERERGVRGWERGTEKERQRRSERMRESQRERGERGIEKERQRKRSERLRERQRRCLKFQTGFPWDCQGHP